MLKIRKSSNEWHDEASENMLRQQAETEEGRAHLKSVARAWADRIDEQIGAEVFAELATRLDLQKHVPTQDALQPVRADDIVRQDAVPDPPQKRVVIDVAE